MRWYLLLLVLIVSALASIYYFRPIPAPAAKLITIRSRNLEFRVVTAAKTVGEVLPEQGFREDVPLDLVKRNSELAAGMTISTKRPLQVSLLDAGQAVKLLTTAATVNDLLSEQKLNLALTDRVRPALESFLGGGETITIDRIVDLAVTEIHDIPFAVKLSYDPESYYGRETLVASGKLGSKEQIFLITYKNGVEIRRKLLSQKVLIKPVTEIRKFGTKIEIEEERQGRASWYAYQNCECAAHPFYNLGRYVRVTSVVSGKNIIVKINDRGPELDKFPDRVIDLDAIVFKKFAPLGAGTIAVKVELLKN